jgi:type I restriction-modification system DNA methylase subunit
LRGDYKQSKYGRVILPLVLLRRLDCVLEPTKTQRTPPDVIVLAEQRLADWRSRAQ